MKIDEKMQQEESKNNEKNRQKPVPGCRKIKEDGGRSGGINQGAQMNPLLFHFGLKF